MKILEDRQTFLGLLSENIAESPRMKAAASIMDAPTLDDELLEFAQINQRIDLYIVTNPDLEVMSYLIDGEQKDNAILISVFKENIERMKNNPNLTDVWIVDENLYQITGSIIRSGSKIHGLLLIGDLVDYELAKTLKEMTESDVSFIVNQTVLGSTIDSFERLLLLRTFGSINWLPIGGISSDPGQIVSTFTLNDEIHQYSLGSFPGYLSAKYVLSRTNASEAAVLDELHVIFFIVGVIAIGLVFLMSFFVARRLTQPLNVLIERSQDIASGNYTHEISNLNNNNRTNDEIFLLAQSFEQMRCSIRNNIDKITNLNTELFDKNSELERALDELKKMQDELIKAEQLSTVGKMVSSIIHDFKSPMQVVKGMTQILSMDNIDIEKKNDLIGFINNAIDRMNQMTLDILDFVQGRKNLNLEKIKLSKVINELLLYMSNDLQNKNFNVTREVNFDPELNIDAFKIKRVFENLFRNAIEESEDKNAISIVTEQVNGNVRIIVHDDRPGIPPEIKSSLFEPFETKGKSQGTGLGLAITKKLVVDHKGTIAVESESGKGTTFIIDLPYN